MAFFPDEPFCFVPLVGSAKSNFQKPLSLSFSCSRKPLESFAALDAKCSRSAHILEASVTEGILRAVSQAGKFGEQPAP